MFNDRSKRYSQNKPKPRRVSEHAQPKGQRVSKHTQPKGQRGADEPMSQEELDDFIVFLKNYLNEEDNDEHETQEYQYDDDWNTEEPAEELDDFIVFLKNYLNEKDNDEHEAQEYHYDDDWNTEYETQEYQYDDNWNTEEPALDRSNYELLKQERNSAILNTCAKAGIFSLMFVGAVFVGVWKATTRQRF